MRKQEALLIAMCAATIAFAVAFVYPMIVAQPVGWYYPLEHRWALESKPTGLAMDFYGRTFQASVAWSIMFMIALPIARRVRSLQPRAIFLIAAWSISVTLLVMAYIGWMLHFRVPTPPAIPAWYQPR